MSAIEKSKPQKPLAKQKDPRSPFETGEAAVRSSPGWPPVLLPLARKCRGGIIGRPAARRKADPARQPDVPPLRVPGRHPMRVAHRWRSAPGTATVSVLPAHHEKTRFMRWLAERESATLHRSTTKQQPRGSSASVARRCCSV